jgi:two-component system CheB/CheR fusion protein
MTSDSMRVVAIGASAGGLKALQELLGKLKPGDEATFVVAQHLSPDHASQLTNLLDRVTKLKVEEARDGQPLSPGHILVVPPNFDATIESGCLKLASPPARFGPSPCIDRLFDSLASACGEHAVAVVLSGTGSDGAFGLRAVRAGGGLTLVQSPDSALFSAMPSAAISLGSPDLIADPETLGLRLSEWLISGENWTHSPTDSSPHFLSGVAAQLKQLTGVDFSQYKESTLLRQVNRRMAVNGIQAMDEYMQFLSSSANESHALMQNLLVTVTAFFRDPEAYEALETHLKMQLALTVFSEPYRVWVPACATGEEAYSIGMLVSKVMGNPENLSERLKIFATDLDEQSLAIARKAIYPASSVACIPEELRERFLVAPEGEGEWEIRKDLRSCLVFARHNICEDPPLPNISLISCRNLLIYFTPNLQQRVIDLLGFSLRPGGLLFLGSSESLAQPTGFQVLNPLHRLYERTEQERVRLRLPTGSSPRTAPFERPAMYLAKQKELLPLQHIQLIEVLIRIFGKPCLVLDQNHLLVEVIGDVSPYCRIPEGRLSGEAISFLRDEMQTEVRALLLLVKVGDSTVRSNLLHLPYLSCLLRLEATPIQVGEQDLIVLSFIEEVEQDPTRESIIEPIDRHSVFTLEIERLERELIRSQDTLRQSLLSLEQANEELEASSEELQASSEELQSSNEELEASNEELQATNDELASVNQQPRIRGDELERLNRDLENIQRSFNQGMVIVDEDLRITRFSPLAVRVFGLVQSDIGAPLLSIPTIVPIQGLRESLLKVVHEGERCNLQVQSGEIYYLMQLMPYRNTNNEILGAIITLTDISELTAIRFAAESSLKEFECLADMLEQVVWKRDYKLTRFLYINACVESLVGWTASEICTMASLLDSAILPADRVSVMESRTSEKSGWDVTYRITRRDGEIRTLREVAIRLDEGISEGTVVGTLTDITNQQMLLQHNLFLAGAFRILIQTENQPIALLDDSLRIMFINDSFAQCLHTPSPDLQGRPLNEVAQAFIHYPVDSPQGKPSSERLSSLAAQVMESNQPQQGLSVGFLEAIGQTSWFTIDVFPLNDSLGIRGVLLKLSPAEG